MTTAHRPTFHAAVGSESGGNRSYVPSRQFSARDLPGQTSMKARPQGAVQGRDFRAELLAKENKLQPNKDISVKRSALVDMDDDTSLEPSLNKKIKGPDDGATYEEEQKEEKAPFQNPFPQDADDEDFLKSSEDEKSEKDDDEEGSDDDDDESDDEKLFEEYERIKKEREEEQKRRNREEEEGLQQERDEELMRGNPLLDGSSYSLEKKWYEDTVFKNQAKTEPKEKQRFINDTVRSDFHRKFLSKYIYT